MVILRQGERNDQEKERAYKKRYKKLTTSEEPTTFREPKR